MSQKPVSDLLAPAVAHDVDEDEFLYYLTFVPFYRQNPVLLTRARSAAQAQAKIKAAAVVAASLVDLVNQIMDDAHQEPPADGLQGCRGCIEVDGRVLDVEEYCLERLRRQAALAYIDQSTNAYSDFFTRRSDLERAGLEGGIGSGRIHAMDAGGFLVAIAKHVVRFLLSRSRTEPRFDPLEIRAYALSDPYTYAAFSEILSAILSNSLLDSLSAIHEALNRAVQEFEITLSGDLPDEVKEWAAEHTNVRYRRYQSVLYVYIERPDAADAPELNIEYDGEWHLVAEPHRVGCTVGLGWYCSE